MPAPIAVAAPKVTTAPAQPKGDVAALGRQEQAATKLEATTEKLSLERQAAGRELTAAKTPAEKTVAQKKVDAAQQRYDAAYNASSKARGAVEASLRAMHPGKPGTQRIAQTGEWVEKATASRDAAAADVKKLQGEVASAKTPALKAVAQQKLGKATAKLGELEAGLKALVKEQTGLQGGRIETLKDERQVRGDLDVMDIASNTRDVQKKLLGAPVTGVSADDAAAYDAKKINASMSRSTEAGAYMLGAQLKDSDEAQQLKLVRAAKKDIAQMAGIANGWSGEETARALMDAAKTAKGQAKAELMDIIAANVKEPSENSPLLKTARAEMREGNNYDFVNDLAIAYNRAREPQKMEAVDKVQAAALKDMRNELTAAKATVDERNGEFARITAGFGESFDPRAVQQYQQKFKAEHSGDYARLDEVTTRYMKMLESTKDYSPAMQGAVGEEMNKVAEQAKTAFETPVGQKVLEKAIADQAAGKPSMLDAAKEAKGWIGRTQGFADLAVRARLASLSAAGEGLEEISDFIDRNSMMLGIKDPKGFKELVNRYNSGHATEAEMQKAVKDVGGGKWSETHMKAVGMLLTAPSVIDGLRNFGNADAEGKVKTALATGKFAVDALKLGNEYTHLITNPRVLGAIGTAGKAFGAAAIPFELIGGVRDLMNGDKVNGATGVASAVGAGLMMIPGGQLPGAVITIGANIVRTVWGENPAKKAEAAQEAEVKKFLQFAKVPGPIAEELSDVLQNGHRNMGTFFPQAAKRMGISPQELMKFIVDNKSPSEVRELVNMIKQMPVDEKWNYNEGDWGHLDVGGIGQNIGTGTLGQRKGTDQVEQHWSPVGENDGPKRMVTALQWMKEHGFVPPSVDVNKINLSDRSIFDSRSK